MPLRDVLPAVDPDDELLGIPAKQQPAVPAVVDEDQEIGADYGPCMAACLPKERRFVLARMIPDISDAEAARRAGYGKEGSSANTLARIAYRLTHENPRVISAIQEVAKIAVRDLAVDSVKALKKIVRQDFHKDQAKVALALMERVDPTVQRQDINVRHEIVDHDAEAVKALRAFKAQGATREFLENWFGYTGLLRYEKILAAEDAVKPITVEYTEVEAATQTEEPSDG